AAAHSKRPYNEPDFFSVTRKTCQTAQQIAYSSEGPVMRPESVISKVHIVELSQDLGQLSGAQSVDRALALLGLVGQHPGGATLTDLVGRSGLNKATVRRLLLALIRAGLVEQSGDSRLYHLGEEAYILGLRAAA